MVQRGGGHAESAGTAAGPDGKPIAPRRSPRFSGRNHRAGSLARTLDSRSESVREIYRQWRPSPMYRALRLEQALDSSRIYYKYKDVSPAGSHKPNTLPVAQAYYNHVAGVHRLSTETGAGQWGSALAMAGRMLVSKSAYGARPLNQGRSRFSALDDGDLGARGGNREPEHQYQVGPRRAGARRGLSRLAGRRNLRSGATRRKYDYALGSVLNHVLLHQTVIGLEAKKQFAKANDYPT